MTDGTHSQTVMDEIEKYRNHLDAHLKTFQWVMTVAGAVIVFFLGGSVWQLNKGIQDAVGVATSELSAKLTVGTEKNLTQYVAQKEIEIRAEIDAAKDQALTEVAPAISAKVDTEIAAKFQSGIAEAVASARERIQTADVSALVANGIVPVGTIVAWYPGESSAIPEGWSMCDGSSGTPDLRERFIQGANTLARAGDVGGDSSHFHRVGLTTTKPTNEDGWNFSGSQRGRAPTTTGMDHNHTVSGDTARSSHLPPYVRMVYIMKIR